MRRCTAFTSSASPAPRSRAHCTDWTRQWSMQFDAFGAMVHPLPPTLAASVCFPVQPFVPALGAPCTPSSCSGATKGRVASHGSEVSSVSGKSQKEESCYFCIKIMLYYKTDIHSLHAVAGGPIGINFRPRSSKRIPPIGRVQAPCSVTRRDSASPCDSKSITILSFPRQ